MSSIIHFAHGNGFPSPCYQQLFNALNSEYECKFIDRIGHNPSFPVTENWDSLVDELIANIKDTSNDAVIGLGHSLGGVLNLLAAIKEPSLFKAVIMLDSPLLGRFKSNVIRVAKSLGFIDKLTPAYRTKGRKNHWHTESELIAYLRSRPLFKTFTEACLQDYVHFGFVKTEQGYRLRFNTEIEYQIFRTIPHQLFKYEGQLKVPTALIYGDQSTVVDTSARRYMKKKYQVQSYQTQGTHMFPMEHPEDVGLQIFKVIDELRRKPCRLV